jgi:hypothetical protein
LGKTLEHISIGNNFLNRNNSNSSAVKKKDWQIRQIFFFFVVLGLELRAFTLSHSTSPIFMKGFLR